MSQPRVYTTNIERVTLENEAFRNVLNTNSRQQLVVMSLEPMEEVGMEIHKQVDQFIRVEQGVSVRGWRHYHDSCRYLAQYHQCWRWTTQVVYPLLATGTQTRNLPVVPASCLSFPLRLSSLLIATEWLEQIPTHGWDFIGENNEDGKRSEGLPVFLKKWTKIVVRSANRWPTVSVCLCSLTDRLEERRTQVHFNRRPIIGRSHP